MVSINPVFRPYHLCYALWLALVSAHGPSWAQSFTQDAQVAIKDDGSWAEVGIPVSNLPVTTDAAFGLESVCLEIRHPRMRDLTLILQSPDGTRVTLMSGMGWGGADLENTCLNDLGPNLETAAAPYTGSYRSMLPLGRFNVGLQPNGLWKLLCRDLTAGESGVITQVRLHFSGSPASPFRFTESPLPIIRLTTGPNGISDYFKSEIQMQIIDNGPGRMNQVGHNSFSYEGKIMAEYQGWSSTNAPKKNIDFNLGPESDPKVVASLAGLPPENDWLLKAEFTDRTQLKNAFSFDTYRMMRGWAPRTRFCEVIIDGEYWGVYTLTEKVKRDTNRLDISKMTSQDNSGAELTGGYIVEMNPTGAQPAWYSAYAPINSATTAFPVEFKYVYPRANEITESQKTYIRDFITGFEDALHGPGFKDALTGYRAFIDTDSFIDFLILNEFTANYDSYGRSTYLYKEKSTKGGKLHMGPPWDYDRAFGYDFADTTGWVWEITNWYWPFPFWWSKLWADEEFKSRVACRWKSYRAGLLNDGAVERRIDSLDALLAASWMRNEKVWPDRNGESRPSHLERMKTFIRGRLAWVDAELNVDGLALPVVSLPTELTVCTGTVFDAVQNGDVQYNWRPGPETSSVIFPKTGVFELEVAFPNGCFTRKPIAVTVISPAAGFTAKAITGNHQWEFNADYPDHANYSWDFGDGRAASTVTAEHSYLAQGRFRVSLSVEDGQGCIGVAEKWLTVNSVGISEDILQVFPNPTGGSAMVVSDASLYGRDFRIVSAAGHLILKGRIEGVNTAFDLTGHPKGIYLIYITGAEPRMRKILRH